MSNVWTRSSIAVLALLFPIAALADLGPATVTLSANTALNLDTGATASSGGDLLWNGTTITVQGSAKDLNVTAFAGLSGATGFSSLNQTILQAGFNAGLGATAPITPALNTIIGVSTNGGNFAKVLVTAVSASITLQYLTYGAAAGPPTGPSITEVQNNYSYILPGLPNYGIAPGTLFIIKGTDLADPGTAVLQSSAGSGIPLTLNGASVSVTVNGVTTHPGLYYAIPTQLAAVLPSSTPVGSGTITVTYKGTTSSAAPIQVVTSALGLNTVYGTGTGLGVATNPTTGAVYNYNASAAPGETVVLWGSGLGADTADSDTVFSTAPHAVNVPLQIYIGGVLASIGYQGSSGFPGLNQINVTIPQSVQPGCGVSVVAISGSVVSNFVTLPINVGGGVCSDPVLGYDGNQILTLGGRTNYNSGDLFLVQSTSSGKTRSEAAANFQNEQGAQSASGYGLTSLGSCIVSQSSASSSGGSGFTITGLDAGNISVTGPSGVQQLTATPTVTGSYAALLSSTFIPPAGGAFTFAGTGGKDIGPFSVTVNYSNPLSWTNMGAITSVNRSQGVTLNWTGGAPNTYVFIDGSSSSADGSASASFICYAPVSAGQFTVPSYVLLALPASTNGFLGVENTTSPQSFSASGLNYGYAFAAATFSIGVSYQ
jgi:uncharacterized protein (TIGR03437 family)